MNISDANEPVRARCGSTAAAVNLRSKNGCKISYWPFWSGGGSSTSHFPLSSLHCCLWKQDLYLECLERAHTHTHTHTHTQLLRQKCSVRVRWGQAQIILTATSLSPLLFPPGSLPLLSCPLPLSHSSHPSSPHPPSLLPPPPLPNGPHLSSFVCSCASPPLGPTSISLLLPARLHHLNLPSSFLPFPSFSSPCPHPSAECQSFIGQIIIQHCLWKKKQKKRQRAKCHALLLLLLLLLSLSRTLIFSSPPPPFVSLFKMHLFLFFSLSFTDVFLQPISVFILLLSSSLRLSIT